MKLAKGICGSKAPASRTGTSNPMVTDGAPRAVSNQVKINPGLVS